MDELGTRSGLSGPSLYRYFSGKDEILATLLDQAMDELLGATAPVENDPVRDLHRALRHHVEFALANRPLITLYQREVRSLVEPWAKSFTRRRAQYTRQWEALVARAHPHLDETTVAATTQGCLGLVFSVAGWPDRVLSTPQVADLILDLVTRGVDGAGSAA